MWTQGKELAVEKRQAYKITTLRRQREKAK
jgi:hypothetical protein